MTIDDDDAALRRARLVDELVRGGWLRTGPWREAFGAVPRHLFVPRFFRLTGDGLRYGAIDAEHPEWLGLVYANSVATTQLDGDDSRWALARVEGAVEGTPTSSSTQPSVMAVMLEALDAEDGQRALEVGTGTGYHAALLSHRLGSAAVTSVEYDPAVSRQAGLALEAAGYSPTLVVGDGAGGHEPAAPYDRLVATYSMGGIPPAWVAQLRPGGVLVTSLYRDLHAGLLVRLTVTGDGSASGRLLNDAAYFMPTRTQPGFRATELVRAASQQAGERRGTQLPPFPDEASGWTALAALLLPGVARLDIVGDDGRVQWLVHPDGSWACYEAEARRVEQGGQRRLWNELEAAHARWHLVGEPARDRLGLTVTPDGAQHVWVDEPDNTVAAWATTVRPDLG